jgi:hypothetical protein
MSSGGIKIQVLDQLTSFFVDAQTAYKKLKYVDTRAFSAVAHNFIPDHHEFVSAHVSTLQR